MEPERVRAYLQAACAGLGFDIGEIWWTSNAEGSSTVAAIETNDDSSGDEGHDAVMRGENGKSKKFRFVQLYTSKSFENRRSELVEPPADEAPTTMHRTSSSENLQKHTLSPKLVDAISNTTQVVWANTKKQEGLTGRSDVRLQTAVGMPVAVDSDGNICVVVMFSPNNIQSTDEAMEYLQSISRSATSTSIPCLMPVFDPDATGMKALPPSGPRVIHHAPHPPSDALGEGVVARFVSLEKTAAQESALSDAAEVHSDHDLKAAPKDTFGIPMLPSFDEFGNNSASPDDVLDVFDEASYGIWTTIMNSVADDISAGVDPLTFDFNGHVAVELPTPQNLQVALPKRNVMSEARKERLEEFCEAFLGMSVFDLADVWVPADSEGYPDCLRQFMSVSSTDTIQRLNDFRVLSEKTLVKYWTGAVGRAYSSGNPVWSANPNVFVDAGRAEAFDQAGIHTVLAVPVFSGKQQLPTCVVSCYSLVKSGSVPFVLRFVQQALRLLWAGLDKVELDGTIEPGIWKDLAPADLGEMAADVEMQEHFITKKRPHNLVSGLDRRLSLEFESKPTQRLSAQFSSLSMPSEGASNPSSVPEIDVQTVHNHVQQAVRSIGHVRPFDQVATNALGTKRAHVMPSTNGEIGTPLPMPRALPSHVVSNASQGGRNMQPIVPIASSGYAMGNVQSHNSAVSAGPSQYVMPHHFGQELSVNEASSAVYTSVKMCRIQGCDFPAVDRRPYCEQHCGSRQCEHEGCSKCAQGSTRFCIAHGGGRRCTFPGCDKGARDKFFCAAHGGGKRCKHEGCSKSAVGGSSLCTAHGGGRRCSVEGCDKSAQSSTKFCVKHGGGKKCSREGCEKVARGRTNFCAAHGGGVRCKLQGCNRVAIGKMQLCRAHGGASSRSKEVPPTMYRTQLPVPMQATSSSTMFSMTGV